MDRHNTWMLYVWCALRVSTPNCTAKDVTGMCRFHYLTGLCAGITMRHVCAGAYNSQISSFLLLGYSPWLQWYAVVLLFKSFSTIRQMENIASFSNNWQYHLQHCKSHTQLVAESIFHHEKLDDPHIKIIFFSVMHTFPIIVVIMPHKAQFSATQSQFWCIIRNIIYQTIFIGKA